MVRVAVNIANQLPRRAAGLGCTIGEDVEVHVWDSTAELRYLVLPERPAGTHGLSEAELAAFVTRDPMIVVAKVRTSVNEAVR
jgi:nitrile hydratase